MLRAHGIRRAGSAALDLCYVACGRFDAYWEWRLAPWDHAAGALIVAEAGGLVTATSGAAFDVFGESTLASNGLLHPAMVECWPPVLNRHPTRPPVGRTRARHGAARGAPDARPIGDQPTAAVFTGVARSPTRAGRDDRSR